MMNKFLLFLAVLCCTLSACSVSVCAIPYVPVIEERIEGLPEPFVCNTAYGKCCTWLYDGCLHTFCTSSFSCGWEYTRGIRVNGFDQECPVPLGYVQFQITHRPNLRD